MLLKLNRKEFENKCKTFLTEGKTTIKSASDAQIKSAIAYVKPGSITFMGANSSTIYARITLECEGGQDGTYIISDFANLYKLGKGKKGKSIILSFEDRLISIGDESGMDGLPLIDNTSGYDKVIEWHDTVNVIDGVPTIAKGEESAKYEPWFSVDDPAVLSEFSDRVISFVVQDTCTIDTTGGNISLYCNNEQNIHNTQRIIEGKIQNQLNWMIEYAYPVLDHLDGPTQVFTYVSRTGKRRLYFITSTCQWQVNMK
jgi:hypothetical protein